MKSVYSTKMQDLTTIKERQDALLSNYANKEAFQSKLSLKQFSFSSNYNTLNAEKEHDSNNILISPLKSRRTNSMQINFLDNNNELKLNAGFYLENEKQHYNNINSIIKFNENKLAEKENLIKSKCENQSELNVSLKYLRGKSFRKSEIKNFIFTEKLLSKAKASIRNFSNTIAISQNTENAFAQFFKKPLTFRVSEFEEKNQIENNAENKQNKTYAQQRFFAHTMHGKNNLKNNKNESKNSNLDDIEKVMLVNNEEELVKKYLLPEIKYMSTQERSKLLNYDVHDNSDKFIIKKSNAVFLSDLLKKESNSIAACNSPSPRAKKIDDLEFEQRKTKWDLNETKFGMFPKFLIKTSSFVKFGNSAANTSAGNYAAKKFNFELDCGSDLSKKFGLNQANNSVGDLQNFSLNNYNQNDNQNNNNNNEDSHTHYINNNNALADGLTNNKNEFNENNNYFKDEKQRNLINKTSTSTFNFKTNNLDLKNKADNASNNIINFNNTISSANAILSPFNSNIHNANENGLKTCYIGSNGYEINREKYAISNNRKHNKNIFLNYPQIKNPIQPYKKINVNKKKNTNYLTNGSLIKDPQTIKKIKFANEKIAKNFKNEKGNLVTLQMNENVKELSKIEKRIADLIDLEGEKMKDRHDFKKFTSSNSIVLIK